MAATITATTKGKKAESNLASVIRPTLFLTTFPIIMIAMISENIEMNMFARVEAAVVVACLSFEHTYLHTQMGIAPASLRLALLVCRAIKGSALMED